MKISTLLSLKRSKKNYNGSRSVRVLSPRVESGSWVDLGWVLTHRVGPVNVFDELLPIVEYLNSILYYLKTGSNFVLFIYEGISTSRI